MASVPAPQRLFTPFTLGPVVLRNRSVRSAAFEGMCPGGRPSPSLVSYHRAVAAGGVGMTTVAYAAVTAGGRTFAHQLWMREEIAPALRELTEAVHREGAAVSIQLGDAGNMADREVTGVRPLAPSRVFNLFGLALPRAMSAAQIGELVAAFGHAARLAREAGFDAVEIQAGHGYLVNQFLSPHTNRRDDGWGGPLANRARLLVDIVRRVRDEGGAKLALVIKTNTRDGFAGGLELDEAVEVARLLEREAAPDALLLSGGFVSKCPMYLLRGEIPLRELVRMQRRLGRKAGLALFGKLMVRGYEFSEAFFLDDALRFRAALRTPLALVGGLRTRAKIEEVLARGFELVALARPLIIEPDFVRKLERGESERSACEPCNRCMATMYFGEMRCTERERLCR